MLTRTYPLRVFAPEATDFRSVRDSNVLIYWPHGFGDLVMLSYLLPLLEPSNRYWITQFGDDYVSVLEDVPGITLAYTGGETAARCAHGGAYGIRHFGLPDPRESDGSIRKLSLPAALYDLCVHENMDTLVWSGFPETRGAAAFPFHSKPRNLLPRLIPESILRTIDVGTPLTSPIPPSAPGWLTRLVEARLRSLGGFGERRLCLISRTGYTAHGKNWGHRWRDSDGDSGALPEGEECRDFMRLMLRKDPRWLFVTLEDRLFDGNDTVRSADLHCLSYAELFGAAGTYLPPFGLVLRALTTLADLFVGVPSGPYCLAMAQPDLPTVGIWIEHFPSWYMDPKPASVHVLSRNVYDLRLHEPPGSFLEREGLRYNALKVDTQRVTGEQVLAAVETLV